MRKRPRPQEPILKSADDITRIKEAGVIIAEIFALIRGMNLEGLTTLEIDEFVDREIRTRKARASFATVPGYSHATCISVNDGVVHGIPSKKIVIKKGDIVKIDVGVVKNGFFADACRTFSVEPVSAEAHNLVVTAAKSLDIGIVQAVPGKKLGDIGYAIQKYVESKGYSVVRDYTGHGVGFAVHEEPTILHYGKAGTGITIHPGMVLAIEPMINAGGYETKLLDDGWTAVTKDGSLSAQFEHTIAVTENGPVILTM
jgi:methionyl aminopeptidase